MLASKRQEMIVDMVNKNGSILVKEVSEKFGVTDDSIRKDLALLEKKGLLKKTYGGAVKVRTNPHDLYVSQRIGKNTEKKQAIAKEALKLLEPGDVIFLDISTSNLELAKYICENNLNITVVTNMIDIMLTVTNAPETTVIFIGGKLNRGRDGFVGSLTNSQICEYRFDKAFVGVVGVDLIENSVYTYVAEDGMTKKTIIKSSEKVYMMLEVKKLLANGNYKFAEVTDFDGAITDEKPSDSSIRVFEEMGVEIICEE